jgi:hypothetical protein
LNSVYSAPLRNRREKRRSRNPRVLTSLKERGFGGSQVNLSLGSKLKILQVSLALNRKSSKLRGSTSISVYVYGLDRRRKISQKAIYFKSLNAAAFKLGCGKDTITRYCDTVVPFNKHGRKLLFFSKPLPTQRDDLAKILSLASGA